MKKLDKKGKLHLYSLLKFQPYHLHSLEKDIWQRDFSIDNEIYRITILEDRQKYNISLVGEHRTVEQLLMNTTIEDLLNKNRMTEETRATLNSLLNIL